jgi:hypothetical protein
MPQLVRIAHHVKRSNDIALNLERRSLHRPIGSSHDDTGQAIDSRKAQREVLAPPFARGANQEPRRAIGAFEHLTLTFRKLNKNFAFRIDRLASNNAVSQLLKAISRTAVLPQSRGSHEITNHTNYGGVHIGRR